MTYFFDTNALLNHIDSIIKNEDEFAISNITVNELERIKTASNKDESVKYKARKVAKYLDTAEDKYHIVFFEEHDMDLISKLPQTDDSKILACAAKLYQITPYSFAFVTEDICCKLLAKTLGIPCERYKDSDDEYHGFKEVILTDSELAYFYSTAYAESINVYDLFINEYLIIKNEQNEVIDKYRWTKEGYKNLRYSSFDSKAFGKICARHDDVYQELALDSLMNNEVTLLGGPAGSGKSYLSLGCLVSLLEKGKIDRIVVFCNPVVAKNAAKLGFYPGTRNEKLLSSQVGAVLSSKFGSMFTVEKMLEEEKLILLPAGDARGYEVPAHSGVYVLEAQNLTCDLMRLLLQRIGEECITIIDGDRMEQTDLDIYSGANNGMQKVSDVFKGQDFFGQVDLMKIHRSKIAKIAENMK